MGLAFPALAGAADSTRAPLLLAAGVSPGSPALASGGFLAASDPAPPFGFVLRRVPNPRYRPPAAIAPRLATASVGRLRAMDFLHTQVLHRGGLAGSRSTLWEMRGGEEYRGRGVLEVALTGEQRPGGHTLRTVRLEGRQDFAAGTVGDVPPIMIPRVLSIHQLRGAAFRLASPDGPQWIAFGGGPTPLPGLKTPRLGLTGVGVSDLRFDAAQLAMSLTGFVRGRRPATPSAADTVAGGGVSGIFDWRVRAPIGTIGGGLTAQVHGLEGAPRIAAGEAIEWNYQSPRFVAGWRDERASSTARVVGTRGFTHAPHAEDRLQLQGRFLRGRGEAHASSYLRSGGDPALAVRTLQVGLSGGPARTAWYFGANAAWDRRGIEAREERRLGVHAGGSPGAGQALLARAQWAASAGQSSLTMDAEASIALRRGVRLTLEPRMAWDPGGLQHFAAASRVTWPLPWASSRLSAGVAIESEARSGFRGVVREASIAFHLVPRMRDRTDLEVTRRDEAGRAALDFSASYDAQFDRYEGDRGAWLSTGDSGRVIVRVARSGNGEGVRDVLVALDGKQMRFTDEEGVARFERVAPGVHIVAVEEKSLPQHHQVAQASSAFVTVERGQPTQITTFQIARPVRKASF